MNNTFLPKVTDIKRQWHEIDASQFSLGRLATRVATILRGKHKPTFTPHMDLGDFVVVTNAKKVRLTGRKSLQKVYYQHSGYLGGLRTDKVADVLEKNPSKVIFHAVRNMLARNRLRAPIMKRLKIIPTDEHKFKIDKKITK